MLAAQAADPRKPQRRAHDPVAPYLVPPIAARHLDPVVRRLCDLVTQLYDRRGVLGNGLLNKLGDILFPPFRELLRKPTQHRLDCPMRCRGSERAQRCDCPPSGPDFSRRRSDGMEAIIRVLLVLASCCNWITMELLDPAGGYLSVWRIAELADLPYHLIAPLDDSSRRRRFRLDTVERVLRVLRTAHILVFTKQQREELEDGRHTSTAPALRKLSGSFFLKWGGELAKEFKKRRDYLRGRAERRARKAFAAGVGVDLGISRELRRLNSAKPESSVTPSIEMAKHSYRQGESTIPIELTDAIYAEHPQWSLGEIMNEARRRLRDPPSGSSGEPHKST